MALYRKLNRETRIRRSILSSLTKDVLTNGHVNTTEQRAKEVRKFVDKMITYAKKGDLNSRRKALAFLNNDTALVKKLFDEYDVFPAKMADGTLLGIWIYPAVPGG